MASATNFRNILLALAVTLATAALFYFGNGLQPVWPLMWLAPMPVLLYALRHDSLSTLLVAATALLLGNLNMWSYLTAALRMPAIAWLAIFVPASIVFAFGVLLFRALVGRRRMWAGAVSLPGVWVTFEYLRNLTTPHGTAGSLAYSQMNFLPFLQVASLTGPWGITFALLFFPCALAIAINLWPNSRKRAARVIAFSTLPITALLIFGLVRLKTPSPPGIKVGLIASDLDTNSHVADAGAPTERLFLDYAQIARRLASQGAKAIVLPEKLGVTLEGNSAQTDILLQSVVDDTGTTIVAGTVHVAAGRRYNEARIYTPHARLQRYDKQHMLPPFESPLTPGTSLTLLHRGTQTWGVAICKDLDFASPARLYGENAAGLLLVPGWDFVVDGSWHGHIAIMRGVEDGFSVARAAKNGLLFISDNRGRIVAETRSNSAPFATLLANVPAVHSGTLYQIFGDWFAYVAIGLVALSISQLFRKPSLQQVEAAPVVASAASHVSR